jgi:N-methylhydantoinase A/oxoprolinase/acetone carboxylase beta subunit
VTRHLVACDAGGTMTDVIVVDEDGRSVIGKAPTTPHDESIGFMESLEEALHYMGMDMARDGREFCQGIETAIYTGTGMLNALLNLSGLKTGLIVTRGFEDVIVQGRASQSCIDLQWPEFTHMQYRKHRQPLVPRRLTRGATERIDMFGNVVIPLYDHEVEKGVRELLVDEEIESLSILFLQSFTNPSHEKEAAEIARRVMREVGRTVPLAISSDVAPTLREISRANATVIQAYASEPAREQLLRVEEKLAEAGYRHSLKTVLCYGGITSIRYSRLFETVTSGPVGGIMGADYLARTIGLENVVCSDVGGTSFDAGAITAGILPIDREPPFQKMYVNVPMLDIRSIGAGTGTYIRLDEQTHRIRLGPDSAGGTPGPVFQEAGNEIPTVNDCNLLLGILNEDYYLGGRVKVNKEKSLRVFTEKIAAPLGLDPYVAAEQCLDLLDVVMREHLVRSLMVGHDLRDYVLLGYGGGGPLHLAGYAGDDPWKAVCTVPHAGAFSAWGGACMDYAHRRHKSVSAMIPAEAEENRTMRAARVVTSTWSALEEELLEELLAEGFSREQISLSQSAYIRYYGQLEDVEVQSPVPRLLSVSDLEKLLGCFEEVFTRMFTLAARPTKPTYHITEVSVIARVDTVKPKLRRKSLAAREPGRQASKGIRPVFRKGRWHDAQLFEMSELRPGNEIAGLAVIEAPNTTLFVPEQWQVRIDEYDIYWLERRGATP